MCIDNRISFSTNQSPLETKGREIGLARRTSVARSTDCPTNAIVFYDPKVLGSCEHIRFATHTVLVDFARDASGEERIVCRQTSNLEHRVFEGTGEN